MKYAAIVATLSVGVVLVAAAACTATNSASSTDGGLVDGGVGDASTSTSTGPLTCLQIFQCATECAETETGCEEACLARGTDEAKVATTDVVTCYQTNACDGGDCLRDKCSTELAACGAQGEPVGTPVSTVPPPSASPAVLVGKWHSYYAPYAETEDWTFNADGTAAHYSAFVNSLAGGCKYAGLTDSTGTVVVSGTTLTYYQTAGTKLTDNCGLKSTETADKKAYTYQWSIDETGKLLLVDQNAPSCLANPEYRSCRTTLDHQ